MESKKRRTDSGNGSVLGLNKEIEQESDIEDIVIMDHDGSKNEFVAGFDVRARQVSWVY